MANSKFALNNCLLFTTDTTKLRESLKYIEEKLEALTARGDQSKILLIRGSHGDEDGADGLEEDGYLQETFFTRTCEALGTTHHIEKWTGQPRWQDNPPRTEEKIQELKSTLPVNRRRLKEIDIGWKLQKNLHKVGAKVEILNIAKFHTKPNDFVRFVRRCQPTAIIVNWCHSEGGDVHNLLTKSGICSQLLLGNERVLLTGNTAIAMDEDQYDCLVKVARKIKRDSPPMMIFLWGPPGNADSILQVSSLKCFRLGQDPPGHRAGEDAAGGQGTEAGRCHRRHRSRGYGGAPELDQRMRGLGGSQV